MSNKIILPSVYLGPIEWYAKLFSAEEMIIDKHEHYIKQTYRNRCRIVGANGIQDLVIPVHAPNHTPMHEVLINYEDNWQRQHWQSIRSAYGNSPFFNFYGDYFSPFYENKKWKKLVDYNSDILSVTKKILKIKTEIKFTETFIRYEENDLRLTITPKQQTTNNKPNHYLQVFEERHGFIPNLSIIDLICCCGPEAMNVLNS